MRITKTLNRIVLIVFSIILIFIGIIPIQKGTWFYKNYWGGLIFSPMAIIVGLLALYVVVFKAKKLDEPAVDKKGRPIRMPGDDYKKW